MNEKPPGQCMGGKQIKFFKTPNPPRRWNTIHRQRHARIPNPRPLLEASRILGYFFFVTNWNLAESQPTCLSLAGRWVCRADHRIDERSTNIFSSCVCQHRHKLPTHQLLISWSKLVDANSASLADDWTWTSTNHTKHIQSALTFALHRKNMYTRFWAAHTSLTPPCALLIFISHCMSATSTCKRTSWLFTHLSNVLASKRTIRFVAHTRL